MTIKLILIESPNKCLKVCKYARGIDKSFIVMSTIGHFRGLFTKKSLAGAIDIENNFKPTYEIKNKKIFKELKKIMKKVKKEDIFLAMDPDREGEYIAYHVCQALKLDVNKVKVLRYNEITKKAIQHAIHNPINLDLNLVRSAEARACSDLLMGFTFMF